MFHIQDLLPSVELTTSTFFFSPPETVAESNKRISKRQQLKANIKSLTKAQEIEN